VSATSGAPAANGRSRRAVVRLFGVTKRYGDSVAIDYLTLDILEGEFFSLLGPSGCGKTTTLRIIGGFAEPDSGRVELAGSDVSRLPPFRRDVNTVFQSYALFPHLDVFDNIAYGLHRRGVAKPDVRRQVSEMLDLVDLAGFDRRRPGQLSGGQQQRVAVARALVNHPKVLLLDEPLGALDRKLRQQMQLELKRIQVEVGITFIYVTHDQEEAMTMSDRLAVMRAGRVEQIGAPQEVYEHPATEFVASFLGASNLLSGTLHRRNGERAAVSLGSGETIALPVSAVNGTEGPIKVGVRPEKIRLLAEADFHPNGDNALRGVLRVATFIGVSNQYTVDTTFGETITVYAQNLGNGGPRVPSPGEPVVLSWHPEHTFAVPTSPGDSHE
jgi:spermidine/putrescine transport system ATP-binding protein